MGQTIQELYFETLPTDLYRHGTTASPQLNKPRTMPPRQADQIHDVKIYVKNGVVYVDSTSGGISTFNMPNPKFGNRWWKLPRGSRIPSGLKVSRDAGINRVTGQIHYTIRPLQDMPLSRFISLLQQLSAYAVRTFDLPTRQVK